jgi:ubiquinone/menaquinone biosynthesis C-methylase UbiE
MTNTTSHEVGALYDGIVTTYDEDRFGLLARTRLAVSQQIDRHAAKVAPASIVDVAVGTGESLRAVARRFPGAKLAGIDISRAMLDAAAASLPLRTIHADVRAAAHHVRPASVDLALVHYLFGYVEPRAVLAEVTRMLVAGGHVSIATSTWDRCFPAMQFLARAVLGEDVMRRGSNVPDSAEELTALLHAHGLEVVAEERVGVDLFFPDLLDFVRWGQRSGWIAQYVSMLDAERLAPALAGFFPLRDRFDGLVVVARKVA